MTDEHWRPGRKVGRTLYIHRNAEEDGRLIGLVDTPELARAICAAMNARGSTADLQSPADERP